MSIASLILGVNSVTVSFLIRYDSLLQNATVITNCDNFITKRDSYYKMRPLLRIATVQITYKEKFQKFLLQHAWGETFKIKKIGIEIRSILELD